MQAAGPAGRARLRASDADRDAVAGTLARALADGRLSTEEHGARLDAAYAARTCGELDVIVGDLPAGVPQNLTVAAARPTGRRRPRITGTAIGGLGGYVAWLARFLRSRGRGGMAADRAAMRRLQRQEINAARRERGRAARELRRGGHRERRTRRQPRRGR